MYRLCLSVLPSLVLAAQEDSPAVTDSGHSSGAVEELDAAGSAGLSDELLPPVRLEAGGAIIDVGEFIAHAGPRVGDVDGDGKRDLMVGDFRGNIHVFDNIGTNADPVYAEGRRLEANGEVVKVPNW